MDGSIPQVRAGSALQPARTTAPASRRDGPGARREFQLAQHGADAREEQPDAKPPDAKPEEGPRAPAGSEDGLGTNVDITA